MNNELTTEQRIQRAHAQIMRHPATILYSSLLMVGEARITDEVPTAATNGRDVLYNPEFVESLTQQELVFLILHEAGHKLYRHLTLWKHLFKENAGLANQAADYVVNLSLADLAKKHPTFIQVPKEALIDYQYVGMDTQEVYNRLKQQGGVGESIDEHRLEDLGEEAESELNEEIEQAIRQGALLASKMGGDVSREVTALLEPKVDWREQLREFMNATCQDREDSTWRRPNRRWLQHDMVMPSSICEKVGCVAVILDTSGSIGAPMVSRFLSEVRSVCLNAQPETLHLIECDAEVQRHQVFTLDELHKLEHIKHVRGGGGTDMCAALDYIKERKLEPDVAIVLTDGYTPFPNTLQTPTLWAITTTITAPVGVTIHIYER